MAEARRAPAARLNAFLLRHLTAAKVVVWSLCLWPMAYLTAGAFGMLDIDLGANPVEKLIHELGLWGLRLLLITLAVTPMRELSNLFVLTRFRRLLGLFAFAYVMLHFTVYAWLDQGLALGPIIEDIIKRPFITIGLVALAALIPLAATSTRGARRRMGRRWQKLHRLVYPIAVLGVWHFYWQEKADVREALIYAAILSALLGWRLIRAWSRRRIAGLSSAS